MSVQKHENHEKWVFQQNNEENKNLLIEKKNPPPIVTAFLALTVVAKHIKGKNFHQNNYGQKVEIILTLYCINALVPFCHKQHVYKKCYWQLVGRKDKVIDWGLAERRGRVGWGGSSSFCTCVTVLICVQSVFLVTDRRCGVQDVAGWMKGFP